MNIKELETQTGITKQNIRFYEKKGLLHPSRNTDNNYREYTQADAETLKLIKVLRKLDVSIEDIRKILGKEEKMDVIIRQHLDTLLEKKNSLNAAIKMCRLLLDTETETLDVTDTLQIMDDMEKKGERFMSIINDYKKISKIEKTRIFSFVPDNMALTPEEFSEALLKYGEENHLNLIVTKESMYPLFEIDGIEYEACRMFGRFGAVIRCTMTHPELIEDPAISGRRKKILRFLYLYLPPLCIIAFICMLPLVTSKDMLAFAVTMFVILAACSCTSYCIYTHLK